MAVRYSSSLIGKDSRICLWPKMDLKGYTVLSSSKFEAQQMPNPAAARDDSYFVAPEQPVRQTSATLRRENWRGIQDIKAQLSMIIEYS